MMLFSAAVLIATITLTSTLSGLIGSVQDSPTAIMAVIAASIAGGSVAKDEQFMTVVAVMTITAVAAGVFLLLLGQFKLGNLVRFLPYPVIGGFLAGTGLLLVRGSITVMSSLPVDLTDLKPIFGTDPLEKWLPGMIFAVLLALLMRRRNHLLLIPSMLIAAIIVFYGVLLATGTTVTEAREHSWLLNAMPSGQRIPWKLWMIADFDKIDWMGVAKQSGSMAAIAVVSAIALLLNASGLEILTQQNVNVNRELKGTGLANMISALVGGGVGYVGLGPSALAYKMGARNRMAGLLVAALCILTLLVGGSMLSYFPNPVVGGLLFFLGLDMLLSWVYDAWFKLSRIDYGIVIGIMLIINLVGFLEGIGVGITLAVILFAVDYSRINVVKHALSGENYHSNVIRPQLYQRLLRSKGDWIYILKLQGFIFFGTATKLLDQMRERTEDAKRNLPHYIVLDFRLVTGADLSAMFCFTRMKQLAAANHFMVLFVGLSPQVKLQLEKSVGCREDDPVCRIFEDLDHGIEWCENQAIDVFEFTGLAARPKTFMKQFGESLPADQFMKYLDCQRVDAGYYLTRQGEQSKGLYFIEGGQVTVRLELASGDMIRLRRMDAGTIVGELGMYLARSATASVVTDQPSVLYLLTPQALQKMEAERPELAAAFHRFMARFMAERLVQTTETLQALAD